MMSWRNSSAVSAVCQSAGKLPWMPRSSSPPKGGLVRITSTRSFSPISVSLKRSALPGSICGASRPCRSRFICARRYGSGLGSQPKSDCVCSSLAVGDGVHLLAEVLERLDQEAAGAAGGVEHGLAEARVDHLRP